MTDLADSIRHALGTASDPERAVGQQAYMKSAMPFRGVTLPETRRLTLAAAVGMTDPDELLEAATDLWDAAAFREERYAAMALLTLKPLRDDRRVLGLAEHMVRTGRWWDITDELAHRLADALDDRFDEIAPLVRQWARDEDMWIRRIAILSQLGRRDRLDRSLLADVITPNAQDREFFIRKAIGWALRDHARADPVWVRGFVEAHPLSPLSRREALKHVKDA
jgi:3-methyladenine DNA glycosylase AlkD